MNEMAQQIPLACHSSNISGNAEPLLHEIYRAVEHLLQTDESAQFDLRTLPLGQADYDRLDAVLGAGEITATLQLEGETNIRECAIAGVWWVEHRNESGTITARLIEVTHCPAIMCSQRPDVEAGLVR